MQLRSFATWFLTFVCAAPVLAQGPVDLSFQPGMQSVGVGDTFNVQLRATSQGGGTEDMGTIDTILIYDPAVLTLLGSDQSGAGYAWFATGFLNDPDNINTDIADGDALFTALSQIVLPAPAPPAPGLLVTTFQFQATAASAGTSITFVPTLGAFAKTRVMAFSPPGLEITGDISSVATIIVSNGPQVGGYCFGDGTGTPCPCGATGAPGSGCANTGSANGALLVGSGNALLSNDTFQLQITGIPGNKPGLVLRGMNQVNGIQAGDGLLCTLGQTARSHVQITSAGSTLYTNFSGQSFGATSYGAGVVTNYQFWYRDPTNTCSGGGFNFTNAYAVVWQP